MKKIFQLTIHCLLITIACGTSRAQSVQYSQLAPIDQYHMEKNPEIEMSRSAAPDSISRDATILVLGRKGHETAVDGKNGFVCMVERGWMGPFGWPEFWNPRIRGAVCLNPQAARSILPIVHLRTKLVLEGRSKDEIVAAVKAAFAKRELPKLESGGMAYMMSKLAYLTDAGDHNGPHLMFYHSLKDGKDWGAGLPGSPVIAGPYWYFSPQDESLLKGLAPLLVFAVPVSTWSDGTPAIKHDE